MDDLHKLLKSIEDDATAFVAKPGPVDEHGVGVGEVPPSGSAGEES